MLYAAATMSAHRAANRTTELTGSPPPRRRRRGRRGRAAGNVDQRTQP